MRRRYMDAIALVQRFGKPDIFLTITCNPSWLEIEEKLIATDEVQNRPDLENQVQATIFSTDITYFEKEFAPFKTFLVSVAHVKLPPLNKFIWTLDKNTIVEPVEAVKPPEDPLPPPTRLTLTTFNTFEYQSKEFEFDVLAIVINGSPSTKTATGKRIQEFIVMDKVITLRLKAVLKIPQH
ncbi:hypothetical protein MTR67_038098 [Solanum verrucosum]|uniref:Helitron helicase-like domain-containing protein n=1 Tax=Solanum verrucosum TaxID=315347 RepID=A0AAF0UF70_SOLVR|nr:hypothetical protein MTR67_038098 [Solanum verrucosum]